MKPAAGNVYTRKRSIEDISDESDDIASTTHHDKDAVKVENDSSSITSQSLPKSTSTTTAAKTSIAGKRNVRSKPPKEKAEKKGPASKKKESGSSRGAQRPKRAQTSTRRKVAKGLRFEESSLPETEKVCPSDLTCSGSSPESDGVTIGRRRKIVKGLPSLPSDLACSESSPESDGVTIGRRVLRSRSERAAPKTESTRKDSLMSGNSDGSDQVCETTKRNRSLDCATREITNVSSSAVAGFSVSHRTSSEHFTSHQMIDELFGDEPTPKTFAHETTQSTISGIDEDITACSSKTVLSTRTEAEHNKNDTFSSRESCSEEASIITEGKPKENLVKTLNAQSEKLIDIDEELFGF